MKPFRIVFFLLSLNLGLQAQKVDSAQYKKIYTSLAEAKKEPQ
ncbi:MAG: hypothetical protein ACXVPE_10115 [Bacteroidia bacterium]